MWLSEQMNNTWIRPIDGFKSLEHVIDVINQTPYDSNSIKLDVSVSNHSDDINQGTLKTIRFNMNKKDDLQKFIK